MDRDALDEFFARADDVLTDWHYSPDAMTFRADADGEPDAADSYYDQREWGIGLGQWGEPMHITLAFDDDALRRCTESMRAFGVAMADASRRMGEALRLLAEALRKSRVLLGEVPAADDPRERALWLRQNRNTGPTPTIGLDGHHRRPRRAVRITES